MRHDDYLMRMRLRNLNLVDLLNASVSRLDLEYQYRPISSTVLEYIILTHDVRSAMNAGAREGRTTGKRQGEVGTEGNVFHLH